jgi:L-alanine-DL-glutamate epimerase-like enolase superfamily enzyme
MALYDITSQDAGLPLFKFLGGNKTKSLITDYTVSIGDPVKMADDARKIQEEGFQFIKVKLGISGKKDIERIRVIRQAVGSDIPLRIDANQGWDTQEAIETLGSLSQFNIQFCEEPVARWNYMDLPKIKKASLIPIMADESCCDHHDAKRLIDIAACDYFNVKLGKSAGIFNALKIIQLAEKNGIKIQIGGFLESRLGFSASAHLALANENIVYFDFDTPLMLLEDHVVDGISYSPVGVVSVPDKPGLGAAISETHLKKLEQVVIK